MNGRESKSTGTLVWLAVGALALGGAVGCSNYGGSVPIDDDAGMTRTPPGSVDASVPIDDDAGMQKPNTGGRP